MGGGCISASPASFEHSKSENIARLRDYTQCTLVAKGMVADFAVHGDNPANPHAHILLTTRHLTDTGFDYKKREWNSRAEFLTWRRDQLSRPDILVIDEAGMVCIRQLQGILAAAEKAKAKLVLVGDAEQMQAIEAGAAFRGISPPKACKLDALIARTYRTSTGDYKIHKNVPAID